MKIRISTGIHVAGQIVVSICVVLLLFGTPLLSVFAQDTNTRNLAPSPVQTRNLRSELDPNLNPNSSAFKIAVCDGPTLPAKLLEEENTARRAAGKSTYVACDFNGVMLLVQHLINIGMVIGVLAAVVMSTYAGGLYITGVPAKIEKAHSIFPKIVWGFILMLSAWFIVYQILNWLTNESGFKTLLGTP